MVWYGELKYAGSLTLAREGKQGDLFVEKVSLGGIRAPGGVWPELGAQ